ncbi:uncharacterized protein TRUGW13939_03683 [Talaromyces rugulosus]|uniref:Uncharacterized protein n=1 Tax=Talaromyces rugulosus TaxID=121627 RepID=A0A7H8QRW2_TALRU|nr:uncharacterized protein TRUGW13939_03683 [Talaromyces rugulosus]QKX56578.1 hypothetical protein TRUGW13939_03683 [Talaromyces rugulosus]
MAEPRLDCLPMELFVMVFEEGCSESDIAHLVRCNKRLLEKLEPIIYSSPDSLSKAMKWACLTGNVDLVRNCIYYGASIWTKKRRFKGIEEFRYCAKKLCSSRLSHEQSSSLLRLLYEKAIDEQGRQKWDADTALPLITLIRSPAGAPLDLIRQVLDDGADPNEPRPFKYRDSLSPLSAAIIANSEPAFHLLPERGADIHGKSVKFWAKTGLHLPIFAAAMTLAVADHGKAMMQLCLENGADINYERICPDYETQKGRRWISGKNQYSDIPRYTHHTSLNTFLNSIKPFKYPKLPNPVERLSWFLEHATGWEAPPVTSSGSDVPGWGRVDRSTPTVDTLLHKWGLARLSDAGFIEIIRILLRHQTTCDCPLSSYLTNFVYSYSGYYEDLDKTPKSRDGLAAFTTLLLENWDFNTRSLLFFEDFDDVLANFISKWRT